MLSAVHNLLKAAVALHQSDDLQAATECCLQVLTVAPEYPDALYFLGVLSAQKKAYEVAEDYFIRAIKVAPKRAEFYGNYANALLEQGKFSEAVEQGKHSIALNPNHHQSHNILGNAYLLQGDFALATEYFRRTLQLNPQYALAHNNLGIALQKQQQYPEAISCFQKALEIQANYPEALYNLGQALQENGQITAAQHCYQQILSLNPEDSNAQRSLREVDSAWLQPLYGNTLLLRRFQASDSEYLSRCYAAQDFMRFYHHFLPCNQPVKLLEKKLHQNAQLHPCQSKAIDWIICRTDATHISRPIGIANLVDIQFAHRRAELLIGIPEPVDRLGHTGLETSLLIMDFAFNRVNLNKLTSYVYGINPIAQKNTLALGFKQEGYLNAHLIQPENGKALDLYTNGLTMTDFRHNTHLAKLSRRVLGRDVTAHKKGC
ncbi:MAG: GNAT family N-acetyltransferase [Methylococcaceae bacterium]|nr:GNAT family N-acetyltransferase [Methylococcaceae bacterium]